MKQAICISLALILTLGTMAQTTSADEQAIRQIPVTMENGWNQKSGELFSTVFADVHDYIVWNGYYFSGITPKANAAAHQGLFNGPYRMVDLKLKVDKIRFVRPDLALAHVYGATFEKGKTPPADPGVLMTLLMEKKEGSWKVISFHNLDLEAFENKEIGQRSPMPLQVMYAGWYKNQ